jgi:hypothetical protein
MEEISRADLRPHARKSVSARNTAPSLAWFKIDSEFVSQIRPNAAVDFACNFGATDAAPGLPAVRRVELSILSGK